MLMYGVMGTRDGITGRCVASPRNSLQWECGQGSKRHCIQDQVELCVVKAPVCALATSHSITGRGVASPRISLRLGSVFNTSQQLHSISRRVVLHGEGPAA